MSVGRHLKFWSNLQNLFETSRRMPSAIINRPTWAEINLTNLSSNINSIKKFIGKDLEIMAVVKADAYGHGSVEVAKHTENSGIDWFGVALPSEGLELRQNGIKKPILCLGSFWLGQENLLLENDLTPVIYQLDRAKRLNEVSRFRNKATNIHIKIDTGMGRIGLRPEEIENFINELKYLKNLQVEGIMTHFPAADDLSQNEFTNSQIRLFNEIVHKFVKNGFSPKYRDLANSPGAIAHKSSHGNLVRLGGIIYGLGEDVLPKGIEKPALEPVLSLYSKIAHLKVVPKGETLGYGRTFTTQRESHIATIPIGYQDGYVRALSNRGRVIINKSFAPIVGRISMDWSLVDVTDIEDVKNDNKVTLIGMEGNLEITAEQIAKINDTISYEITCGINRRVTRKYVKSE